MQIRAKTAHLKKMLYQFILHKYSSEQVSMIHVYDIRSLIINYPFIIKMMIKNDMQDVMVI